MSNNQPRMPLSDYINGTVAHVSLCVVCFIILLHTRCALAPCVDQSHHTIPCLQELWSQPELRKSKALVQFLKTGVLRHQWHLSAAGAATTTNGGNPRRRSLPLGGALGTENASATAQRPKRQSQEVISAFLNAQLPMAYRTSSPSSESSPLSAAEPLHSLTTGETPVEDLTASMVLVRNHLQLNQMQPPLVSTSETRPRDTGAADESTDSLPMPNGPTSTKQEYIRRRDGKFGPKEFLNFAHDALRFRFPSVPSGAGPEGLQRDGQLTNSLFCLANEAARPVCSELWLCRERVQRALLAVMGGALDR